MAVGTRLAARVTAMVVPRIEELLEARKPKEACVLARKPGVCQVEYQDSEIVDIKVVEDDGTISEYPLLGSQNPLVSDNQRIDAGQALTDGQANPHEILELLKLIVHQDRAHLKSSASIEGYHPGDTGC